MDILEFSKKYFDDLNNVFKQVNLSDLNKFIEVIEKTYEKGNLIYVFGNGGSAAISNHLLCDFSKGVSTGTHLRPRIVSLSSSVELITAFFNDESSQEVFRGQLRNIYRKGDICIAISSSGNSPDIIRAVEYAKSAGSIVLGMSGFSGGELKKIADYNIYIPINNYGIVEDIHQSFMHIIAQFIKQKNIK